MQLKQLIREIPDFPKPGIKFYDITTLLKDKRGFGETIEALQAHYRRAPIDVVVGIEARGYFFAPAMAHALHAGFVPVRNPKSCPTPFAASNTSSNMAPISSKCMPMPSSPVKACSS